DGQRGGKKPRDKRAATPTPSAPTPSTTGKLMFTVSSGRPDAETRAIAYLKACPPAISGQGGHVALLNAARGVVLGFDLGVQRGFELLKEHYNPRCIPEWSDAELLHKCNEADTVPYDKVRGWLLNEGDQSASAKASPSVGQGGGGAADDADD